MEGLKHLASCVVPAIYDAGVHDRTLVVSSESAIEMVQRQARRGVLLGWSGGAALAAAERLAGELDSAVVVVVLPDGGERYLDDPLWKEIV